MGQTSAPHGAPSRTETWKCQGCGATNRAGAQWCGQCFVAPATTPGPRPVSRTTPESPPESAPPEPDDPAHAAAPQADPTTLEEALLLLAKKSGGATAPATAARQPASAESEATEVDAGAFSVRAGEITWVCKWCEARNLLAEQSCSVCGAGFGEVLKEEKQQVTRDPGTVALISLFFPGAGHAYMGDWGQGVARAVVSIWAVLVCFFAGVQGGEGMLLAIAFGVIAFCLWVISAHDAFREASGSPALALIKSRHFLYLVLGLLGLQLSMVFIVALSSS
jgi:hypothetical protein